MNRNCTSRWRSQMFFVLSSSHLNDRQYRSPLDVIIACLQCLCQPICYRVRWSVRSFDRLTNGEDTWRQIQNWNRIRSSSDLLLLLSSRGWFSTLNCWSIDRAIDTVCQVGAKSMIYPFKCSTCFKLDDYKTQRRGKIEKKPHRVESSRGVKLSSLSTDQRE